MRRKEEGPEDFRGSPLLGKKVGLECPNCGNDGGDGSISGKSLQYGIKRICKKCGFTWAGGIGVQQADTTDPLPPPGVPNTETPDPADDLEPSFRDPKKNFDV